MNELASKMIPKKGKSLKSKSITISDELARRLNEYNRAAMLDPQPFNEPQPVAINAGNPFDDDAHLNELFDAALDEENHDEEFIEDHMEIGEEAHPEDVGFDLAGGNAEPMVEDEPVIEIGEPGEGRPAVEEREEIRPMTLDEARRHWMTNRPRPVRMARNNDTDVLVADRINRLYGNYMPYGDANGNVTFTFDTTSPIAATTVTTAQLANATRIVNDTETAGRDNG